MYFIVLCIALSVRVCYFVCVCVYCNTTANGYTPICNEQ